MKNEMFIKKEKTIIVRRILTLKMDSNIKGANPKINK